MLAQVPWPTTGKGRPRALLPVPRSAPPHQIDITELVEPEAVLGSSDSWEVVGLETLVAEPHSLSQPTADPAVHQALMAYRLGERGPSAKAHHMQGAQVPRGGSQNPTEAGTMGKFAFQEPNGLSL